MNARDPTKPTGAWEVRHKIKIPQMEQLSDARAVERAISSLPGVNHVLANADKHRIVVRYDARQTAYLDIVGVLEDAGFPPADSRWNRIRSSWFQTSDTIARDNAKASPPACCNRPPRQERR